MCPKQWNETFFKFCEDQACTFLLVYLFVEVYVNNTRRVVSERNLYKVRLITRSLHLSLILMSPGAGKEGSKQKNMKNADMLFVREGRF